MTSESGNKLYLRKCITAEKILFRKLSPVKGLKPDS